MHSNTLTAQWAATITGDQSTVFSGAGVWPLLVYLAAGTTGTEYAELTAATGPATPAEATALLERLTGADGVTCDLAIEVGPGIDLRPTWTSMVPAQLLGPPGRPRSPRPPRFGHRRAYALVAALQADDAGAEDWSVAEARSEAGRTVPGDAGPFDRQCV